MTTTTGPVVLSKFTDTHVVKGIFRVRSVCPLPVR